MASTLLINPSYFRTYGSNEGGIAFPVFPVLSLASLAGAAIERGHQASILDLSYQRYDPDLIARTVAELRPDVVGITASTPLTNQLRDISYLIKDLSPETLVVGGGAHPSALPAETLMQSALDAVAAGEGDWVIADLLDGISPAEVAGLYVRDGDAAVPSASSPLLDNLDKLPMPAWGHYPLAGSDRVSKIVARHTPITTIEFSRGCVYRCDFCGSKNSMGLGYRKKSPERCADEMVRLASLGFREALVVDDIFTSDTEWAAAVCEEIIKRGSPLAWTCSNGIRVDSASLELFQLMAKAGCYRVYFGFESGSDEVLRAFGKGGRATTSQGISAVDLARQGGLEPNGYFMVGLSGDTEETMRTTIDYARKVRLDSMKCGMCVPFPGTPMFNELHAAGRIKTYDWDAYTVYNDAKAIFDHPTTSWDSIIGAFKRFYVRSYFGNPRYLVRRLRYILRNREVYWNVYYTLRFLWMLWGPRRGSGTEEYAFEDRWRPSDFQAGDQLGDYTLPRASKGGGAAGRDGAVTVKVRGTRRSETS